MLCRAPLTRKRLERSVRLHAIEFGLLIVFMMILVIYLNTYVARLHIVLILCYWVLIMLPFVFMPSCICN